MFHSWNNTQTINTNPNKEALEAHGFSQKERIVQNISLALNIPDIQPIRAINITKNRTNVHGAFWLTFGEVFIVFICSFTITCCYVSASSIYFHIRHSRIQVGWHQLQISRTFQHWLQFSRTFKALNFYFEIQGLSRTFKARANPVACCKCCRKTKQFNKRICQVASETEDT